MYPYCLENFPHSWHQWKSCSISKENHTPLINACLALGATLVILHSLHWADNKTCFISVNTCIAWYSPVVWKWRTETDKKLWRTREIEVWKKHTREAENQMAEINVPFSHMDPVKKPPPYEKKMEFEDIYPQLPVISQKDNYHCKDEDSRIKEVGQAETIIKMYPSYKSKKKKTKGWTEEWEDESLRYWWKKWSGSDHGWIWSTCCRFWIELKRGEKMQKKEYRRRQWKVEMEIVMKTGKAKYISDKCTSWYYSCRDTRIWRKSESLCVKSLSSLKNVTRNETGLN